MQFNYSDFNYKLLFGPSFNYILTKNNYCYMLCEA